MFLKSASRWHLIFDFWACRIIYLILKTKKPYVCRTSLRGIKCTGHKRDEACFAWRAAHLIAWGAFYNIKSQWFYFRVSKRSGGAPALCVWAALSSSHQHVAAACFQCSISHHGCIRRRSSWCKAKCLAVSMKLRNSCKEVIEQNMGRVPTSWYLLVPVQYPSSEARTTCRMSRKGTAALLHAL